MLFAEKMKELMRRSSVHIQTLADASGVSSKTMYRWLSGSQSPRIDDLPAIAAELGVSVGYLADDSIDRPDSASEPPLSNDESRIIASSRRLGTREMAGAHEVMERLHGIGGWRLINARLLGLNGDHPEKPSRPILGTFPEDP